MSVTQNPFDRLGSAPSATGVIAGSLPGSAAPPVGSRLPTNSGGEPCGISDADPQRGVILEPDDLGDLLLERDAQTGLVVGSKGDAVIGKAEPQSDRGVPAVGPGDHGVVDVVQRGLDAESTEGDAQLSVVSEVDAVTFVDAQREEQRRPSAVESVRKRCWWTHGGRLPDRLALPEGGGVPAWLRRGRITSLSAMKAMAQRTWNPAETLELIELPTPEPGKGEVRVKVQAIGVNPVDWKMRTSGPLRLAARLFGPKPPVVVGVDFAGVVESVGAGVTRAAPGDRVVGGTNFARGQRGSYADTVLVREDQLCRVPDTVDIAVAAALPVSGVTAQIAVVDLGRIRQVQPADRRVLVLGASGCVGQLAVQIAKSEGAFVAGVCSTKNTEMVADLGADVVLDYNQGDALAQAKPHAPFHVIVDCVGSYAGGGCRALLSSGGRHIMVAGDEPSAVVQMLVPPFKSRGILGRPTGARLQPLVAAVAAGKLRVAIAQKLPLTSAEEAHQLSRTSRLTGKLILEP